MNQLSTEWNDAIVHDLLHYPQRLSQHPTWSTVIAEAGGLQQLRQQLLEFPLKAKQRRVLEVILAHPEASVVRYTDLLSIHHATFHRQQNALCHSLSSFLNTNPRQPELIPAAVEPVAFIPTSLVRSWTSFVGRQADLDVLSTLLTNGSRWISLVGTGGVGKTRLAFELAQHWVGIDCDEVHVLRFADVQHVEDIGLACMQQLQLSLSDAQSIEQAIQQFFENRRSLLILDNLEHLPAAGEWLASLFAEVPQLQVLATSRVRLNVLNEIIYEVDVLAYPALTPSMEPVSHYPAVQLCLDRLEAVRLIDRSDQHLLNQVGQICCHVAGLPLAIELVAARAAEYSLESIVTAIRSDLGLLAEGPLDVDIRHQTMAATIGWSYRLLPAETQAILCQLSVFQAGWDVAAAAALADLDHDLMEDHLSLLLDNHLISIRNDVVHHPYTILEPIRHYAWQLLSAEQRHSLRLQHCDYYITWVTPTEEYLIGPDHGMWHLSTFQAYPNIQLALHTAKAEADPTRFWQLLAVLYRFWWGFHFIAEARSWIEPVIPRLLKVTDNPYLQCRVLYTAILFCSRNRPDYSHLAIIHYLIDLTQKHGFYTLEAKTKNFYALILMEQNKLKEAGDMFLATVNLYQQIGDETNVLGPMFNYANLMWKSKRLNESYLMFQDLAVKFKQMKYYLDFTASMKNISLIYIYQEKYFEAEKILVDLIAEEEHMQHIPLYLGDYNLYFRLIKVYFFLKNEQGIDRCIKILYPVAVENTVFIEQVFFTCESLILVAIIKQHYLIALAIYWYFLNVVETEKYAMRWNEREFLAQTKIVLSHYCDDVDFVADPDFCLEKNDFNTTMNYYIKLMYGF
ncbi:ATP-binding protein [Herpetosiphon sp. NSE202]|uniref:ATP-binding protein n=1 Tax=Herpetosiphon sp. NSE202 TaxID=3351349 RepID=UPI0036366723